MNNSEKENDYLSMSFVQGKKHLERQYKYSAERFAKQRFDLKGIHSYLYSNDKVMDKSSLINENVHRFGGTTALSISLKVTEKKRVNLIIINKESALQLLSRYSQFRDGKDNLQTPKEILGKPQRSQQLLWESSENMPKNSAKDIMSRIQIVNDD